MRGYNLSSKPDGVAAYDTGKLAADVRDLISERGAQSALLVGHDWGGTAAWATAMNHPEVVDRLAILNAAHPRKLLQGLHHPGQLRKSWYFFFFDLPDVPEAVVHANQWHFFRHFLHDARPAYTPEEMDRYIEAWSQPDAATGMINYYRSSVRTSPKRAEAALRPIEAPTLVIWGQNDGYLGPELAEPDHDDVPNLDRVERLLGASHWVHHDAAERVTQLLTDFSPLPAGQGLTRDFDERRTPELRSWIGFPSNAAHPRRLLQGLEHPAPAQEVLVPLFLSAPRLAESVVRARRCGTSKTFCTAPAPALKRRRTWNATSSSTSA